MSRPQHRSATDRRRLLPLLGQELLAAGYRVSFRARGQSMVPAIRCGEKITVEPVAPERLRRGDIVLLRIGPRLLAHRLVSRWKSWSRGRACYLARGDASRDCDPAAEPGQVLGRVVRVERRDGGIDLTCRLPLLQLALVQMRRFLWRVQTRRRGPSL